jgi:nucleoside 2-deoxyribosyltransferase
MSQQTEEEGQPSVLGTHSSLDPFGQEISHPPRSYTYYHAGPLFTLAELHTNTLLSQAVARRSNGKFIPILPQDLEQRDLSPQAIRDQDLRALVACDLALFTYDGAELDAGTVVEYMVAKAADVPSVILRSDFRGAGDQGHRGDGWNLMSSNWPRSVGVTVNAMVEYKMAYAQTSAASSAEGRQLNPGEVMVEDVAQKVIEAFEKALKLPTRIPKELQQSVYHWLALMPGFKEGSDQQNAEAFAKICRDKQAKKLL